VAGHHKCRGFFQLNCDKSNHTRIHEQELHTYHCYRLFTLMKMHAITLYESEYGKFLLLVVRGGWGKATTGKISALSFILCRSKSGMIFYKLRKVSFTVSQNLLQWHAVCLGASHHIQKLL